MLLFSQHKKLPWLGIATTLSIVALLCFQGYWLYNGYRNTYNKFVENAQAALQEACDKEQAIQKAKSEERIKQISLPSVSKIQVIKKDSLNKIQILTDTLTRSTTAIRVSVEKDIGVNLNRLDSLFSQALVEKGLNVSFVLEGTTIANGKENTRTIGEHKKGQEVKIQANNIQLMSFEAGTALNINMSKEHISAYLQFTPLTIFKQMVWTLVASVLLFLVILYCLMSQLRVIRQQKSAAKMRNDFIANFTHELKTPIAVVYAALDNIERNPTQPEKAVEAGKAQLKRLSDSVEKILSLSVGEQGHLELHREEVVMNDWLTSLVEPFRLRSGKGVTFELTVTPPNAVAYIDKVHFANALNNIIDNAIKYSGEQVQIVIACRQTQQNLQITIHDNGLGIAEENQKRIFDRFYRVKNTSEKVKGFGLGLNYAKTIIELHGATISVESILGKGSTFTIDL